MELNVKAVAEHFGMDISGKFIVETLGVEPARREKKAMYWTPAQIPQIASKLVTHVQARAAAAPVAAGGSADDLF